MGKLSAAGLVRIYGGRRMVDQADLHIHPGKIVGLLGPNGAGKTTTFDRIAGLIRPHGGQILLDGENVSRCPICLRARRVINYLPQEPSIFRKLTVKEGKILMEGDPDTIPRSELAQLYFGEPFKVDLGTDRDSFSRQMTLSDGGDTFSPIPMPGIGHSE